MVVMVYEEVSDGEELEEFMAGGRSGMSFLDFEALIDELGGLMGDELWVSDSTHLHIYHHLLVT